MEKVVKNTPGKTLFIHLVMFGGLCWSLFLAYLAIENKDRTIEILQSEAGSVQVDLATTEAELEGLQEAIAAQKNSAFNPLKMHVLYETRYGQCLTKYREKPDTISECGEDSVNESYIDFLYSKQKSSKFLVPELNELLKTKSSIDLLKKLL